MNKVTGLLEVLAREADKPESEILSQAIETGLLQMWRERTLGRYLKEEITRDEAVSAVGIDWVELAERQHSALREDLQWAMNP